MNAPVKFSFLICRRAMAIQDLVSTICIAVTAVMMYGVELSAAAPAPGHHMDSVPLILVAGMLAKLLQSG